MLARFENVYLKINMIHLRKLAAENFCICHGPGVTILSWICTLGTNICHKSPEQTGCLGKFVTELVVSKYLLR